MGEYDKSAMQGQDFNAACFGMMKEATDFALKSVGASHAMFENLFAARSLNSAFEIQRTFAKTSYLDFIVEAHKVSQFYEDLSEGVTDTSRAG